MAWDPPAAIFHRFRATNALNLLILQTDVSRLQEELLTLTQSHDEDRAAQQPRFNWSTLETNNDKGSQEIRYKIIELRKCLKQYSMSCFSHIDHQHGQKDPKFMLSALYGPLSEITTLTDDAILQQKGLNTLPSPDGSEFLNLRNWLKDVYHGGSELQGPGSDIWSASTDKAELLCVWPRAEAIDWLTKRLFGVFPSVSKHLPQMLLLKFMPRMALKVGAPSP